MNYPELLRPTATQDILLPSQTIVAVPKCTPRFPRWQGKPVAKTYGGKAVLEFQGPPAFAEAELEFQGRPAFAELVILWNFRAAGWDGVWITNTFGKPCYRQGMMDVAPVAELPPHAADLLTRISEQAGSRAGAWDVFCWRGDAVLFAEAKRRGGDRIRPQQIHWLGAALACGIRLPLDAFLVVEWSADKPGAAVATP